MNIVIVGGSGGIGSAMLQALLQREAVSAVHATYQRHSSSVRDPRLHWHQVDVSEQSEVEALARQCGQVDWLINAVGFLHSRNHAPEKTVRSLDPVHFFDSMRVNALPTLLLAKHFRDNLKHSDAAVFATISARVGSIGENRLGGWYSYRSSKAALNMALKTLSIEWRRDLPRCCVAALHPGTTDTPLSKPFQARVAADHLFSTAQTAGYLLRVLDGLTAEKSGRFWSFDGTELPW